MPVATEPLVLPNEAPPSLKSGKRNGTAHPTPQIDIVDIRRAAVEVSLKEEILSMFHPKHGPRQLPTLLLYDERGLQIFEDITYLDEYYLTNDEIAILTSFAADIVKDIPHGSMLIELGSGNLRKVNLLLEALEAAEKEVDYYALDLSKTELERTLAQLPSYRYVRCHGLLGTYDDGREWLKNDANIFRRKCILSLGSSIGNFSRDEAADFLRSYADVLNHGDRMLIGLDSCQDPARVYHAYNDKLGLTHRFVLNGLVHANQILGQEAFVEKDWRVIGEYVHDEEGGRHQAFYAPLRDTMVLGEVIRPHERVQVEQSLKYSGEEADTLWKSAGMTEVRQWRHDNQYGVHMLSKPDMPFSLIPSVYGRTVLPTIDDWRALWVAWDVVTRGMLPGDELLAKPIKLRNACIFYLGHIPTFLDIQLTKTTKQPATDPAAYYKIFERGIDPDVDNPALCHAHSEIPDEWPQVDEILAYQDRVRARLQDLYASGQESIPRHVGQAIWVGFEHELMHIETLLYMLLQSDKTLPPPHTHLPNFEKLAVKARSARVANEWFDIPAREVSIGLHDPDGGTDPNLHFGWDNEKPPRRVNVHSFQAQGRPITNEEYARYMYDKHITKIPASWAEIGDNEKLLGESNGSTNGSDPRDGVNGYHNGYANGHSNGNSNGYSNGFSATFDSFFEGKAVRTVYGLVPLKYALDWPIFASYDELTACAAYMGGRIPTFEEARSIYAHADALKRDEAERKLGKTVPAVNGHLSNNGVHQTPPAGDLTTAIDEGANEQLFADLDGANIGFHRWHPVAVTGRGNRLAGQGELGGVWEWTSSVLRPWEGFAPMALYPGYTSDFFDEKHNIVLGGSWATHPRIAGRKTFVNWYQRNYPYAWVGARLVRDIN